MHVQLGQHHREAAHRPVRLLTGDSCRPVRRHRLFHPGLPSSRACQPSDRLRVEPSLVPGAQAQPETERVRGTVRGPGGRQPGEMSGQCGRQSEPGPDTDQRNELEDGGVRAEGGDWRLAARSRQR